MRRSTGERDETENVFSLLIKENRTHELDHIFKFLTGIILWSFFRKKIKSLDDDVLRFSQVSRQWRKYCLGHNVFEYHERELLKARSSLLKGLITNGT